MADFLIGSSTLRDGDTIRSFLVAGPQTVEPMGVASAVAFGQPELILSRLVHRLRVMEAEFGRPGVYILRTVADYAGVYSPVSSGGVGLGYQVDTIPLVGNTLLLLMDTPMLRDSDDNGGFYLALGIESGEPADWRGAVILRVIDNVEFEDFSSGTVGAIYGYAKTTLATTTRWASWDRTNTVSVRLRRGSLSNITPLAALNGGNAALLGDELIHFTTATQTAADEYTLSEIIRARRGTDFAVGTHKAGERFLLLEQAALLRPVFQLSDLNKALYYKLVSIGGDLETARSYDFANAGVALKPYAGTRLRGARDGGNNLTITWERRS